MRKRTISAALAAAMLGSVMPMASAAEDGTPAETANNSVSGYVSLTDGVKIAGDMTTSVYVDSAAGTGVQLAAENMKTDIETVTGGTVTLNGNVSVTSTEGAAITAIDADAGTMTVSGTLEKSGRGVIAVYDGGALSGIYLSGSTSEGGTLSFTGLPSSAELSGKTVKGFLWADENGSLTGEPLAPVYEHPTIPEGDWSDSTIIIGTVGTGGAVDTLAAAHAIDTAAIESKWESFTIQEASGKIVIAGSDERGTIYGIYDLCEKIGVSPWSWWADAEPVHADALYIDLPAEGYTEGEPSVKYRGIFLNDEYNFNQWSMSLSGDNMSPQAYEKVYELILRLKANTMWPAMHAYSNAFHTFPASAELADKYGIVIGTSHAEPLLRNNLGELDAFQDKWEAANPDKTLFKALKNESGKSVAYYWTDHDNSNNPVDNKEFLEAYWRESVQQYGGYENIYTLGMRGVHDGSFQTNMDYATALNEIIECQRRILKEEVADKQGIALEDIPQVFIPYKDIQSLYNSGKLNIPDDVTIMWTDDNYGYIRQNADDAERARSGRTGIYYHVSYYGYPTSYLWLSTTQPGLIREELGKSYDMGADRVWILNTGDLKPAEKEIEYFARLARDVEGTRSTDISDMYADNARRDFNMNDTDAAEYAAIMDEFYALANSKRPDFFRANDADSALDISLTSYGDEAERYLESYKNICERAEALYASLPSEKQAAFFELALYPIRSARNMAVNYIQSARAELYSEQQRGTAANRYAAEASAAADAIETDINTYNTMLDGKWANMTNINPSRLQGCDAHITLDLNAPTVSSLDYTELAVMTDSQTEYSDAPSMTVSSYDSYDKFIDVINKGYGSFDYTVSSTSDALVFDKTEGTAYGSDRVRVSVDGAKAETGILQATVTVSQLLNGAVVDSKDIAVTIENPNAPDTEKTYVEAGGTVSVEAEHYTRIGTNGEHCWQLEKDFGRSGDSMKVYPDLSGTIDDSNVAASSAYLEYDIYFTNTGTYKLSIYRMPTLNERGSSRVAAALDGGSPVILRGTNAYTGSSTKTNAWSHGVLTNNETLSASVTVSEPGVHTLRIYSVSPSVTIDKATLTLEDTYSYFGAPESYNTTYNTSGLSSAVSVETAPESEISKTFEPKAVIGNIEMNGSDITGLSLHRLDDSLASAVIIAAGYDAAGNVTSKALAKAELNGSITDIDINMTLAPDTAAYAVYAVDPLANMAPIAPYKVSGTIVSETYDDYDTIKADLSDFYGKKSVVLIANGEINDDMTADDIAYVYGETLDSNSYRFIPALAEGEYSTRVGIDGAEPIDGTLNTIVNIYPDNEDGETVSLGDWTFDDSLTDGTNAFTLSGGASLTNGQIKLNDTSTGSASMVFPSAVTVPQGETAEIEFDIIFGKLTTKTVSFGITDGSGNALVSAQLHPYYLAERTNITIGGTDVYDGYEKLSAACSTGSNTASGNKPTHFKAVIDFTTNRASLCISYDGGATAEYSGKLGSTDGSIGGINFTTSYTNSDRACYVDNVSAKLVTGPLYYMTFTAVDSVTGDAVESAAITVKDGTTGAVIDAEGDGTYHLCEGDYVISAEAAGYRSTDMPLELIPALESKEIKIPLVSTESLVPASVTVRYTDENGAALKEDSVVSDGLYVGDSYELPASYMSDITKKNADGKTELYVYNAELSTSSATLTENTELTLVFSLAETYDYYEDFEEYTLDTSAWTGTTSGLSMQSENGSTYLRYAAGSGSVGAWTAIDETDCTGKTVRVEADIRFAPSSITGDGQFSIASSSPTFSGGKVDWGVENATGHIVSLIHKKGSSAFLVNGQSVSTALIGGWFHMTADIDFVSRTATVHLTNDSGYDVTVENAEFYSSDTGDNIGAIYMRGAGGNGNVSLDNFSITAN